ncbi:unnamed protein product [Bursaphelenchus xylophilus]|uniref:(pine wood nematode) hypothetical protein n=1 Tax=Bursaphelenchus xylophilus TaxID=6326 RepID=A0A1I7S1I7_BURXY|nr:unnamed protein product [Bursaphelenchus xylophilus]CAG9081440.1 unnamed protein product [Bursaphelenchus xylophilus]
MKVFLLTLAVFGIAYGYPAPSSDESSESTETSRLDNVLDKLYPNHRDGVKKLFRCMIAAENRTESDDDIADELLSSVKHHGLIEFYKEMEPHNRHCFRETGDKLITALANVDEAYQKDKKEIKAEILAHYSFLENIPPKEYLNLLNELQPKDDPHPWYLRCSKSDPNKPINKYHKIFIALIILSEEFAPESGLPVEDPTHYLNPKLFTTGNVPAQELIVNCIPESEISETTPTTETPFPETATESTFDEVLEPVGEAHRAAIREWIQCVGRQGKRTVEEIVASILAYHPSNWTVRPFTEELLPFHAECAFQSEDEFIVALGKLVRIRNKNYKTVDKILGILHLKNFDQFATGLAKYSRILQRDSVSCHWEEKWGKEVAGLFKLTLAYGLVGEQLIPGSGLQWENYRDYLNPELFDKNNFDIKINDVFKCLDGPETTTSASEFLF